MALSKKSDYRTAGSLTLALSDFIGSDIAISEVTEWLKGTKVPCLYHLYKLSFFFNTSLDSLFSGATINNEKDLLANSLTSLFSPTAITNISNLLEESTMTTTNNTSISITKTSKKQMDEVVRSRTSSRNYNILLANKVYGSNILLKDISSKTGVPTSSLRDYCFYNVSVPVEAATKLISLFKTSARNLGLTFNKDANRYMHLKVTVKA